MTIKEKEESAFMKRLEANGATIQIRHINGQRGGNGHIKPTFSKSLQRYLGFEKLSEEDEKKKPWFINKNSNFDIHDRMDIDLSDKLTLAHWQMAKYSPMIAFSEKEARESNAALFYIHSAEESTRQSVTLKLRVNKVKNLITEDAKSNLVVRARLLGYDMSADSELDILDFLLTMAETNPEKIEGVYEDAQNSLRMLLAKGISSGIIREDNKFLMYGAFNVGNDEDTFVRLMSMKQSSDLLEQMRNDIEGNIGIQLKKTEPINTQGDAGSDLDIDKEIIGKEIKMPPLPEGKKINSMNKEDCLLYIKEHKVETLKPVSEYNYQDLKKIVTGQKL